MVARSAGIEALDLEISFPPLWTPTASETASIAKQKAEVIVSTFQAGLLDAGVAMQELKKLEDETGLFGSLTDQLIAAAKGKTYQDVTALRDPLAGLLDAPVSGGADVPTGDALTQDFNPYHDSSNGRFTGKGGSGTIGKTKYAPSPQRGKSKIQLKPKTYARLTGILNTRYPGLKAGDKAVIRDATYQYHVTADGFGGMSIQKRFRLTKGKTK